MVELDHRLHRIEHGVPLEGDFAHEALLLREGLVELERAQGDREARFPQSLDAAIDAAGALETASARGAPAPVAVRRMKQSCTRCHEPYRDR